MSGYSLSDSETDFNSTTSGSKKPTQSAINFRLKNIIELQEIRLSYISLSMHMRALHDGINRMHLLINDVPLHNLWL
jgi:hypothetical protein